MNDAQRIQRTVSLITGTIIMEILVIIISAAYVLYLSVIIGLISLSSIILYLFIAWKYHDKIVQKQKEVMATYAANESNYVDTLQGSAIIKSFGKEKTFIQRLTNIYQLLQEKIYDLGNLGNTYSFLTGTTASLFIVVIIFIGIRAVLSESLQLGEFIAILSVGGSLVPSIAGLVVSNIQIQEAQVAFDRMHEFVKHEVEYKPASDRISKSPTVNHITVQNLRFRFPGKKPLLDKVDLHIEKGKIVALFGEVGSGKSTLVDILQRFYVYEAGNILVDDKDWKSINLPDWREKISIVPQKEKIFNSTVLDNICLSNDQNEFEEVIKLCESYGFNKFIEKFQQGYLTLTGENGINLSGGQRQLISLARALYKHPEFLILDEATSAMDFTTEDFVFEMLKKQRNLGVLIITHRKDLVLKADEVYQLKDNRIYKMENQFMT
jgi:ATP-binding cassette subfamily B protein